MDSEQADLRETAMKDVSEGLLGGDCVCDVAVQP